MAKTQRVAIITSAAGGNRQGNARALLTAGIRVAGVDRDREAALAASAREIPSYRPNKRPRRLGHR